MSLKPHFQLTFKLLHPNADLHELARTIGLSTHRIWTSGDKSYSGFHKNSCAALRFEGDFSSARELLTGLISYLQFYRETLNRFTSDGGMLSVYLSVGPGEHGQIFSAELIEKMGLLKIALELEFYP